MPDKSLERSTIYSASSNGNGNGNGNGKGNGAYVYSMPILDPNLAVEDDRDSIDLRQIVNVVKHRFRLIGIVAASITTASILWSFNQEPKYQGSFQLLVEPVNQQQEDNTLSILGQEWSGLDYETQIEVLRSPSTLTPIIDRLGVRYPDIQYDDLIKRKNSPLQIDRIDETKILNVSYTDTDPQKIDFVLENLAQKYLSYSLEERRAEVNQGIEFVRKELPGIRSRVDKLQEELQEFRQTYNLLDPQDQATIISDQQVSFEEQLINTQQELGEAKALSITLQNQLGKLPKEAITSSYLSDSPRYQKLLNELQEVELQLAQESVRFSDSNPVIISLKEKQAELVPLLEQEATKVLGRNFDPGSDYTTSSPSPSSLRSQLDLQYIQTANQIETLEIREQALEETLSNVEGLVESMPAIAREYNDLQRELNVATDSLNRFLAAQEELQLEAARQALPWQIIAEPAQQEDPVSPNIPRNIALGMFGGLILGFGAALLAERLDPVFHSSEEIKESVKLPMLGIIPVQKDLTPLDEPPKKEEKFVLPQLQIGGRVLDLGLGDSEETTAVADKKERQKRYDASPFSEAFRSLNTNIKLLGSDSPINSLVISSSIPSEGKSTISSHLAQAAAAMGQKVLLVDADLRRPQVHRWTGLNNTKGLSNIISTPLRAEVEEQQLIELVDTVTQKPEQWESLSVITAGDIPPDPTRLLSSQRMHKLMELLKRSGKYDLIIYDTPPILGFADGRILANRTNGVVLVVRIGKTDRSLLKQNLDNLKVSHVPVLGLVANHTNRHSGDSYHYYNHYYGRRNNE